MERKDKKRKKQTVGRALRIGFLIGEVVVAK